MNFIERKKHMSRFTFMSRILKLDPHSGLKNLTPNYQCESFLATPLLSSKSVVLKLTNIHFPNQNPIPPKLSSQSPYF